MNIAARALEQGIIIARAPVAIQRIAFSKNTIILLALLLVIILSALAVITMADKNRIAVGELAMLQQQRDELHTHYGQLLLEDNTWSAPLRVETMAQQRFGLVQPTPQQVIIIHP